ncbi:Aste57867_43 [Aphanomyces stellatus]|uniref:Aste57867_43 protein n=1 Tax=Aphanomyces stellatus TaxID=120398 RepID=A0A485K6J5_9STRA|nr:hypothetical protein As57867_000043 [Aphanomyces stellatus]VFT77269.1 Aste57867_43 [Aphanomyces stellatus]
MSNYANYIGSQLQQCLRSALTTDPVYYACVLQSGLFLSGSCALQCDDPTKPTSECCSTLSTVLACKTNTANTKCKQTLDENLSTILKCSSTLPASTIGLIVLGCLAVAALIAVWILVVIGKRNALQGAYNRWTVFARATRQLRVLIWKNMLLVKSRPFRLVLELLLPLVLASPLVVLANLDVMKGNNRGSSSRGGTGSGSVQSMVQSCQYNFQNIFTSGQLSSTMNSFYSSGQPVFGMFFLLSFLRFVPSVTSRMVIEKETRIAEGMRMMGMKEGPLLLSWFVTGMLQYTPVAIAMAVELKLGNVFPMADLVTLFFFFFTFMLSIVSFSNLIAVFFNKSKTAAIASVLLWVIAYLPFYAVQDKSMTHKYFASLSAPAAFALGINYLVEDAQRGTGAFYTLATMGAPVTSLTIGAMSWFLVADSIVMLALSWYFQQIVPQEYGVQKPWNFLFQRTYWKPRARGSSWNTQQVSMLDSPVSVLGDDFKGVSTPLEVRSPSLEGANHRQPNVEEPSQELKAKERAGDCVQICGLRKAFQTEDGEKVAVHSLDVTMYAGQITAMLGHNGAGKTTTISMLTGLYPPTSGTAYVFGKTITEDMDQLRASMGVCPQHDVLYDELTVDQHLQLYAALKNVPPADVAAQVNEMIKEVGLTEKRNVMSKKLSGGQKRKLSVAIALIGHSQVVFLDEPTSGMDPYSRRFTWNVLQQNRANRVMVLTTHFMDEADLLGDRIVILSEGRLVCAGSSLFLKNLYGTGYNLTLVKADGCDASRVVQYVQRFVPTASVLSMVGSELVLQLPTQSSAHFPALLQSLDASLAALRILEYGISITTLEEVFLRIAHQKDTRVMTRRDSELQMREWRQSVTGRNGRKKSSATVETREAPFGAQYVALVQKRFRCTKRDKKGWIFMVAIPVAFLIILAFLPSINVASYLPMYKKGGVEDLQNYGNCTLIVEQSKGDIRKCIFGQPIGGACSAAGAPCQGGYGVRCDSAEQGSCSRATVEYNSKNTSWPYCASVSNFVSDRNACMNNWYSHCKITGDCDASACCDASNKNSPFAPCSNCLTNTWPCYSGSCLKKDDAKLQGVINTFLASLIIVIGFAFVPASAVVFIVKEKHPHQNAKYQQMACGTSVLAYWMSIWTHDVLFMLVPVGIAVGLLPLYSSFKGDTESVLAAFTLLITHTLTVLPLAYLFSFKFTKHSAAQTSVLVFGLVTGALISIFSFLCRLISFDITSSLTLSDLDTNYLRWFYLIFPGYQLTDGLFQIGMRKYGNPFGGKDLAATSCSLANSCWTSVANPNCCTPQAFEFNIAGRSLIYGLGEVLILTLLVLYADRHKPASSDSGTGKRATAPQLHVDDDVVAEAERVGRGAANNDTIFLNKVHKQYGAEKVALQSLSLGVPLGECFGYLGINGAGKSTTMQILNGFLAPSSGAVRVGGFDVRTQLRAARRTIGYCPQFDALHDTLTVEEELELYARLKGLVDVRQAVEDKIRQFDLMVFRKKLTRGLSGGNKRKVSTAIALMGSPQVLLLDEPSTGMDPAARRGMWDVLVDVLAAKSCSILLTTHSMEECQALCTRIGILVSGRLTCLGTAQHLKQKFGRGFTLDLKLKSPTTAQLELIAGTAASSHVSEEDMHKLCNAQGHFDRWDKIQRGTDSGWVLRHYLDKEDGHVPRSVWVHWWAIEDLSNALESFCTEQIYGAQLVEHHGEHFRYHIPKAAGHTLTSLFALLESPAAKTSAMIEQYSLSDTTLEEIFNGMAAGQEEEREAVHGVHRQSLNASSLQAVQSYHRSSSMTRQREHDF